MSMPEQVRKQVAVVKELYKGAGEPDQHDGDVTDVAGSDEPSVTDMDQDHTDKGPDRQAPAQDGENPDGATTETTRTEEETFEQKYKTLQGMYNADVPRLHADKRELEGRVQQLEQLISSMNVAPVQQPATPDNLPASFVTEADKEDYGDAIEVMRKVFREEMSAKNIELDNLKQLVQQMQGTVVPQVQQLSQSHAASSEQRFWTDLQTAVPDWQDINGSKDFQAWLLEADPLTGISRQTYLDDAQRCLDVGRVINFFSVWKGKGSLAQTHATPATQRNPELERQIAPGKGRSGGARTSGEPRTWTPGDIRKFFSDVQKGRYRGKEAERDRIERDIFAAQQDGRMTTGV